MLHDGPAFAIAIPSPVLKSRAEASDTTFGPLVVPLVVSELPLSVARASRIEIASNAIVTIEDTRARSASRAALHPLHRFSTEVPSTAARSSNRHTC
jgi:hypothetical protein